MDLDTGESMQTLVNIFPEVVRRSHSVGYHLRLLSGRSVARHACLNAGAQGYDQGAWHHDADGA